MRRILRTLLTAATVGSLVLCLALTVLWARSYWVADSLVWRRKVAPGDQTWLGRVTLRKSIGTWRGGLLYGTDDMIWPPESDALHYDSVPITGDDDYIWEWAFSGFARAHSGGGKYATPETDRLRVPLYALVLVAALLPAARLAPGLRLRRRPPDTCPTCGYDCRATPERCPECGTTLPVALTDCLRGAE